MPIKIRNTLAWAILLSIVGTYLPALAQAPVLLTLAFEVASVKRNKSGLRGTTVPFPRGGRFVATNATVMTLLLNALNTRSFQIVGGPPWIESDRFDLVAKADREPNEQESQVMLRSLLADRFAFAAHTEMRERPIYRLILARPDGSLGPSLIRSNIDCEELARTHTKPPIPAPTSANPQPIPACSMRGRPGQLLAGAMSIDYLIANIESEVNRVVVNAAGLTGSFAIMLQWAPEQTADASGPSYFTALQEQLERVSKLNDSPLVPNRAVWYGRACRMR